MAKGSVMLDPTAIFGFSDACGSWNTIWIPLRIRRSSRPDRALTSWPSKRMRPVVASWSRTMA
jgi:hypothetical protein